MNNESAILTFYTSDLEGDFEVVFEHDKLLLTYLLDTKFYLRVAPLTKNISSVNLSPKGIMVSGYQ